MSPRTAFALIAAGLMQVGCGSVGGSTNASGMGPARCTAANAKQFLGQQLDAHNGDDARAYAGAMRSRIIRPGDTVTMDADPLRLNIELDPNGRIHRLRCG
jgi:Peptidase inhibitor I78 family